MFWTDEQVENYWDNFAFACTVPLSPVIAIETLTHLI